jgi:hypothetical protein
MNIRADNVYPSQKRIRGLFFGWGIAPRRGGIFAKNTAASENGYAARCAAKKQKKRDPVVRYGKNRKTDNTEVTLTDTDGSSTRPMSVLRCPSPESFNQWNRWMF